MRLLIFENGHTSLTHALLIFGGARFSLSNVGFRFFDGAFRPVVPFGQYFAQRFVHHVGVNDKQHHEKDDGRNGPEQ
jgi:hypothetical protein